MAKDHEPRLDPESNSGQPHSTSSISTFSIQYRAKGRQPSSSSFTSLLSIASEASSVDDRPEWFLKDTSVQFQKTPAEQDPAVGFFYTPRTLTILSTMLLFLVYVALTPEFNDTVSNVKIGIAASIVVFCVFGMLQFRDSLLLRPHPALWRVVLSFGVVYQLFLVFLLFQNKHDARLLFTYIDPSLGVPLPEKSYGDACDLNYENIKDQVFDVFTLAHAVGWFCKALILRDYTFCWILSVMFEVMEYSLSHQLNNFDECWWDHWILDVLVCNWLGIYLGVKTCEYFEMKQYSWQGLAEIPTLKGKMKRTMQQFTPKSWTKFEWDSTKSFKSYATVIFILTMLLICELNAFYLKSLLWLPPAHPINITRIFSYFMFGIPGVRETYQYLHDVNCKRIGPQAWLLISSLATEVLIVYKFGQGEFSEPAPVAVIYFWIAFLTLLTVYPFYQFYLLPKYQELKIKQKLR
ncbi:phosphatidyl serine synthase-domain-containing protein [Dissophora ornata]|nr:phosphatidyl serine synthase-domain-containing protein [Dissophora ornata]